jgi:L-rhamnose isomerase
MGTQLKNPCVNNIWIPDGYKDVPVDRARHRALLKESLDAIFAEQLPATYLRDALEPKLFGIGSESCTFGSLEFYLGYAVQRQILLCLDSGHYHPTEVISDKLSSVLLFTPEVLLHVSRGIRWDSDHVVILADELVAIAQEVVRGAYGDRIHIGLDFFDGTLNRVAAWTIGTRSMLKALLCALLENTAALRQLETSGDYTGRLAILEEQKSLPWQAVWDYYCLRHEAPVGRAWLDAVRTYEKNVQFKRQ